MRGFRCLPGLFQDIPTKDKGSGDGDVALTCLINRFAVTAIGFTVAGCSRYVHGVLPATLLDTRDLYCYSWQQVFYFTVLACNHFGIGLILAIAQCPFDAHVVIAWQNSLVSTLQDQI